MQVSSWRHTFSSNRNHHSNNDKSWVPCTIKAMRDKLFSVISIYALYMYNKSNVRQTVLRYKYLRSMYIYIYIYIKRSCKEAAGVIHSQVQQQRHKEGRKQVAVTRSTRLVILQRFREGANAHTHTPPKKKKKKMSVSVLCPVNHCSYIMAHVHLQCTSEGGWSRCFTRPLILSLFASVFCPAVLLSAQVGCIVYTDYMYSAFDPLFFSESRVVVVFCLLFLFFISFPPCVLSFVLAISYPLDSLPD